MDLTFRAIWPILDDSRSLGALALEAAEDLPWLATQARAVIEHGAGTWRIAPSNKVPGSGNTTANSLIFEAPAQRLAARPYHLPRSA